MERVLVADDQHDVLESLQLLLKNEGFAIDVASSPRAVVEAVQSRHYDVLLLDMNYARDTTSGGEGLELLSRISELDQPPPVVLMTAWGSVELAVEAMRNGGCDFVQKPWNNRNLIATLRRNVERGKAKHEQQRAAAAVMRELGEARETQQRLLPDLMPRLAGMDIHTAWLPASEVGGDYFDAIPLSETSLALCIADVSGKGVAAALLMSNIQANVRAFSRVDRTPSDVCAQLNRVVCENTAGQSFVTLFYAVLDVRRRTLTFTNAGHVPPVLIREDGCLQKLSEGGTVLGLFPDSAFEQAVTSLSVRDHLVLMTDGITEASNADGEQFGDEGRIAELLMRNRRLTSQQLKDTLLDAVASFCRGSLQDDAALMVLSLL
ncbi:MAG TPA: SpoIIE family protein phosphatase [Terriglobia bacterium]|nr:SpoIIE family protein phosphatase [Terriglobia bacterium]